MIDQNKLDELQKCIDSPYYFFTTYFRIDGELTHTFLSEEEFNFIFKRIISNGK